MITIFSHPVEWAAGTVGSPLRFWLVAGLMGFLTVFALYLASTEGFRAAAGVALFLLFMQFYLLYALRAMYRRVTGQGRSKP